MGEKEQKKMSLKARVLTVILGVLGVLYWLIGKAENAIESLYEN